jgi:hypothetical protein
MCKTKHKKYEGLDDVINGKLVKWKYTMPSRESVIVKNYSEGNLPWNLNNENLEYVFVLDGIYVLSILGIFEWN